MSKQTKSRDESAEKKPVKPAPEPKKDGEVTDEQLDNMAGGFNPQPDPPGFQIRLANQFLKFFRR